MNDDYQFCINLLYQIIDDEDDGESTVDRDDVNVAIQKLEYLQQQERRRTLNKNSQDSIIGDVIGYV